MIVKKTRKEGQSTVVVLPRPYCRALQILPGDYVTMRPDHNGHLIIGRLEDYLATALRAKEPKG